MEVELPAAFLLHVTRYSIFSNSSIILDYGLLLELHALTLAARSYALLGLSINSCMFAQLHSVHSRQNKTNRFYKIKCLS